jgi:DNA-binding response OmpR family regulator
MSANNKNDSPENKKLPMFRTCKQGRVLLAESDSKIRHKLKFLLESQGYNVFIVEEPIRIQSQSRFRGYAFILFNWFMKGESGINLCQQIRTANKATPVFFYTTPGQREQQTVAFEETIQDFNIKSAKSNDMLRQVFLYLESLGSNRPGVPVD